MADNAEGQRKSLTYSPVHKHIFRQYAECTVAINVYILKTLRLTLILLNGLTILLTEHETFVCVLLLNLTVFCHSNIRLHLKSIKLVLLVCASYVRPTRGSSGGPQRSSSLYV